MELCSEHSGIKADIENLKNSEKDQWTHITAIETALPRLVPIWITIVLTVMGALTGSSLTFAAMMLKFANKI
jgi:hypothetical protein